MQDVEEDGEIIGDEDNVNFNVIRNNELQKKAREMLSMSKNRSGSMSTCPGDSKGKSHGEKHNPEQKTATSKSSINPDDNLCVICIERKREVMIVACRHLVYCKPCERDYHIKYPEKRECPICRKDYKKTLPVLYT